MAFLGRRSGLGWGARVVADGEACFYPYQRFRLLAARLVSYIAKPLRFVGDFLETANRTGLRGAQVFSFFFSHRPAEVGVGMLFGRSSLSPPWLGPGSLSSYCNPLLLDPS